MILDGGVVTGAERLWPSGGISGVTALVVGPDRDAIADRYGLCLHIHADGVSARSDAGDELFARPDTLTRRRRWSAPVDSRRFAPAPLRRMTCSGDRPESAGRT